MSVSGLRCFIKYRAGKHRCRGSTGAFTRLCSVSVVTSSRTSLSIIGCHGLQCSDGHGSHSLTFSCRKRLSLQTRTQTVSMLELVMASARIVHLVGHKRRIPHRSCPSDFLICSDFPSCFGEYLMSLVIS